MDGILVNIRSTSGGPATATLALQAIKHKKIFVFGELLALPQIQSLSKSPDTAPVLALLEIFAFGTFLDYASNVGQLPEIGEAALFKLRQLTVVSLAARSRSLAYSDILRETQLKTIREAEDLLIACVYDGLIRARLDQRNQKCQTQWCSSRDVRPEQLDVMIAKLSAWCVSADDVLLRIDNAMDFAARQREQETNDHKLIRDEAESVKLQVMHESSESTLGAVGEPTSKNARGGGASAKAMSMVNAFLKRG